MTALDDLIPVLDEHDLLDLGNDGPWPGEPEPETTWGTDWTLINAPVDDELADAIAPTTAAQWAQVGERLRERYRGRRVPPPDIIDALAWYLPFHYYGTASGIYIHESAILEFTGSILSYVPEHQRELPSVVAGAARSALWALFSHEAFHHKVESFATRLELLDYRRRYCEYTTGVYGKLVGSDGLIEESLACAEMIRRRSETAHRRVTPDAAFYASDTMLRAMIPSLPPGYNRGVDMVIDYAYQAARNLLSSQVDEAVEHPQRNVREWSLNPDLYRGFLNCRRITYVVVPQGQDPVLPWYDESLRPFSVPTKQIKKLLKARGFVELSGKRGKGSHTVYSHPATEVFVTLPDGSVRSRV